VNIAILGAAFGDEGKGHITHFLSKDFDWVIRFNGGANAGHTIYRDGVKYVHNLMPSFDWRATRPKAFLGSGMVIDLEQLIKEVTLLWNVNSGLPSRVYVDPDAFIVLPEHKEEDKVTNGHIGSTNRGIGPAYKSKIGRTGTRIKDLIKSNDPQIKALTDLGVRFKHALELKRDFQKSNLLFEGAQGIMLDINHGTYPYVSSSDCTTAGIYASGFSFAKLDRVYGVAKVYTTKVGEGPFPTELLGAEADELRERGGEYGATTGRPRRVGWLDLPALDYACQKAGITHLILTKFDILNGAERVKLCVAYDTPPICPTDFFTAKPQYITVPGWKDAKQHDQLEPFMHQVEKATGCQVTLISAGVNSSDITIW
jgi:adenylosuccinate synthase